MKEDIVSLKKAQKGCKTISYIEHLLVLASTVAGFVSIFAFAFLFGVPIGIASSTIAQNVRNSYKN